MSKVEGPMTEALRSTLVALRKRFPVLRSSIPLKVNILRDLYARCPGMETDLIRKALKEHCTAPEYLENLISGATRFDLKGNPCGQVTQEQIDNTRSYVKENPAAAEATTGSVGGTRNTL